MDSPKRRSPNVPPWRPVSCPGYIRFFTVVKEQYTNGRLYAVYRPNESEDVWLGQSLYGMLKEINKLRKRPKLHSSTAYRFLRGDLPYQQLGGMIVEKLKDVEHVNELLDRIDAPSLVVVTRDPDKWELKAYKAKLE